MIKVAILFFSFFVGMFFEISDVYAGPVTNDTVTVAQNTKRRSLARAKSNYRKDFINALKLAQSNRLHAASVKLFQLSMSPRFKKQQTQIKYILGLMLYRLGLNQMSAYQFISIINDGNSKYLMDSIEKLSLAADTLGDDTLLNYALKKVRINKFPDEHKSMLFFRIGEYLMRKDQYSNAIKSFARVNSRSPYFPKAKYLQGLAFAEQNKTSEAISVFNQLIRNRAGESVTDTSMVSAQIGKARTLYQAKQWKSSIDAYRDIPRDSQFWHDTLFESSWAMLRAGKFRSALSNFHSLHSSYYEKNYLPESLLLRGIVYLYICQFEEMEKVLELFNKIYKPLYNDVRGIIDSSISYEDLYNQVNQSMDAFEKFGDDADLSNYVIPFIAARRVAYEGDYQSNNQYIKNLYKERNIIKSMPNYWRGSSLGRYSEKVINIRIRKAKVKAGRIVKKHLIYMKNELFDLFEQEGFIKFEMLKGKKNSVKKSMSTEVEVQNIDSTRERDYYIQNGYEYWPFQGEYWLDELGNYHYLGKQSCE